MKKIQKKKLVPFLILIIVLALALILINNRDEAVVGKVYYDDSGWECSGDKCTCIFQGCSYNGEVKIIGSKIANPGNDPGASSTLEVEEKCGILCKFVSLLVGNKEARAGRSWFDRENLVGRGFSGEGWNCEEIGSNVYECTCIGACFLYEDIENNPDGEPRPIGFQIELSGTRNEVEQKLFYNPSTSAEETTTGTSSSGTGTNPTPTTGQSQSTIKTSCSGAIGVYLCSCDEPCIYLGQNYVAGQEFPSNTDDPKVGSIPQGTSENVAPDASGTTAQPAATQPEPEEDAWPSTTTTTAAEEIDTEEGLELLRLQDGSITQTTTEILEIMQTLCQLDNSRGCIFTSSNTFTENNNEFTIRENRIIQVRDSENGQVVISQWAEGTILSESGIVLSGYQYDQLVNDEEIDFVDGNFVIGSGENQRTISQKDWGLEVKQGENIYYIVGDVEIKEDGDGNWIYREEEYENEPEVDANSLTLSNDDNSIVISRQESTGRIQIVETDTDSPRDSTTTILLEDGGKIVEKIEDGKLDERERLDSEGRTVWEDQVDNEGNFQGRYWYFVPVSSENEEDNSFPSFCDNGGCVGWCREDTCEKPDNYFNIQECGYDDGAYSNCYQYTPTEEFRERNYQEQLWTGNIGQWDSNAWQDFLVGSNAFFGHSVSAYPLANVWEGYKNYMEDVDEFFATHYLGVDYWTSEICRAEPSVSPNEGIGFIETISGDRQSVAYVVAEKIPVGGMLCDPEGKCPNELTCRRDQFCYEGNSDEPEEGYLYRIDWKVTAPRDEEAIVYTGGARQGEINFNLKVFGERESFLFSDAYGIQDENVITLKKGENSATNYTSLIVEYSTLNFNKICIEWGNNKPQTRDYTFGADFKPLKDVCNDIIEAQPMLVQQSPNNPGVASRSSTGVTYCGLSGC